MWLICLLFLLSCIASNTHLQNWLGLFNISSVEYCRATWLKLRYVFVLVSCCHKVKRAKIRCNMQVYIKTLICNWRNKSHAGLWGLVSELKPITSKTSVSLKGWEQPSASRLNKFGWRFMCPQLGLKSNTLDSTRFKVGKTGTRTDQKWN